MDSKNIEAQKKKAIEYFSGVDWNKSRLGLSRIAELLEKLGNPQKRLKFVHVAGTNGKGSVCAVLASILKEAGYKTGLHTSPYIQRFNERIQIDGKQITDEKIVKYTKIISRYADLMEDHPTEFELVTALAFLYFAENNTDIVVLEVGLGGRLDATNVIDTPEIAVITSIGVDHTAELGNTISLIAAEKAGIIKQGTDVVLYPQVPDAEKVFEKACKNTESVLHRVDTESLAVKSSSTNGQIIDYMGFKNLQLPLLGSYQPMNAATAITAAMLLKNKGWGINENAIRRGISAVRWPARFERVRKAPDVIVDGGHNPNGAAALAETFKQVYPCKKVIFVAGVMRDKNYKDMIKSILPLAKHIVCVTPQNPRALLAEEFAEEFKAQGFSSAEACTDVTAGVKRALEIAKEDDVICAFGSLYMAGQVLDYFEEQ